MHELASERPDLRLLQAPIWLRGEVAVLARRPAVTIVGARAASAAGLAMAAAVARAVAERQGLVVSGGALGIDAAAHSGAIAAGGRTLAVLGCGVDVVYPQRHAALFEQIRAHGCLLSSYPPGTPPVRWHFPERNELMAALADLVVLIEATADSGSLITVEHARRHGRPVVAFPGSDGAEAALAAGAHRVQTPAEVLALLAPSGGRGPVMPMRSSVRAPRRTSERAPRQPGERALAARAPAAPVPSFLAGSGWDDSGATADGALLSAIQGAGAPLDLSELCARTGLLPADCAAALIDLELRGQCTRLAGGRYIGPAPLG